MASTILLLQFNNKHLFFVLWQSIPRNIRRPVTLLLDVGIRGQNREVVFHTARISCVCGLAIDGWKHSLIPSLARAHMRTRKETA